MPTQQAGYLRCSKQECKCVYSNSAKRARYRLFANASCVRTQLQRIARPLGAPVLTRLSAGGLLDAIAELHRSLAQLIVDIRRDSSGVARARAVLEAHIRGPHRRDRTLLELARAVANADRLAVVRGSAQAGAAAGAVQGAAQDGVPLPEAGSAAGAAQRAVVGTPPFLEGFIPPSGWLGPSREELRWAHYSDPERFVPPNGWLGPSPEELRWAHYRDGGEPGASRGHVSAGVGLLGTGGARLGRGLPPLPGLAFTMGTRRGAERQSQRGGGACRPARSTRAAARPARPCGRSRAWPWRSMGRLPMGGRASASRV